MPVFHYVQRKVSRAEQQFVAGYQQFSESGPACKTHIAENILGVNMPD